MDDDALSINWTSVQFVSPLITHPGAVFKFCVGAKTTVAVGLAGGGITQEFSSVDYGLLFREEGTVQVYEKGSAVTEPWPYVVGNMFALRVIKVGALSLVSYVLNDKVLHDHQNPALRFPLEGRVFLTGELMPLIRMEVTPLTSDEAGPTPEEAAALGATKLSMTRMGAPLHPHMDVGYNIYRSTDPNIPKKQWKRLNPVLLAETSFSDTNAKEPGVQYYFYITAINAYGMESEPSEVITADPMPHDAGDRVM